MRGTSWKTWVYCVAAAGFKIWLAASQTVSIGSKNSINWLYLQVAQEFAQGHWFGASSRVALRFPPGYSLWCSLNHLLGISLRLGAEFLLILAAFAFLLALRRTRLPELLSCLLFTLIVFDPTTLTLFQKANPQTISWSVILLAGACYFLSTYSEKLSSKDALLLFAGFFLAAYWLSQASIWVPLLLVAWMTIWELSLQSPDHSRWRRLALVLPVLGLLVGPALFSDLLIRSLNRAHYGSFALQKVMTPRTEELMRFQDSAAQEKLFEEMAGNRPRARVPQFLKVKVWTLQCQDAPPARSLLNPVPRTAWSLDLPELRESWSPTAISNQDACPISYLDETGNHRRISQQEVDEMSSEELDLVAAGVYSEGPGLRRMALEAIPRVQVWAAGFLLFSLLLTAPIFAWSRWRDGGPRPEDYWLFLFSALIAIAMVKAFDGGLRGFDWMAASHWPLATLVAALGLLLMHHASKVLETCRPAAAPRRAERWFLGFALGFGVFFVFANPPFQGPDEIRHAFRSYQVSEGLPRSAPIPQSLVTVHAHYENLPFRPANKVSVDQILADWKIPLNPEHRAYHGSAGVSFFPNLPQGLGMFVGRHLGLPTLGLVYLGRLFNLLFWTALIYLAIRQLPFYRWMFCFAALSPMGLYQASSLSYDGFNNAICFLLISTFLSFAYGLGTIPKWKILAMIVQGILASLAKVLYFPLVFLYLLIPVRRFGSKLRYFAIFGALLLSSLGVDYLWNATSGRVQQVFTPVAKSQHGSLSFVFHHPWEYLALIGRTLQVHGARYLEELIGKLGWTDTYMPAGLLFLYAIGFLLVARWDNRAGLRLGAWPRSLALVVVALVSLAIFAFFYLTWSPLDSATILGLQGRYFIPIVPALALAFYWNGGDGRRLPALDSLVPFLSGLILLVAAGVLLVRYYPL